VAKTLQEAESVSATRNDFEAAREKRELRQLEIAERQLELASQALIVARKGLWYAKWTFLCAIPFGAIAAVVATMLAQMLTTVEGGLDRLNTAQSETRSSVQTLSKEVHRLVVRPILAQPSNRARVGPSEQVSGTTSLPNVNHYIVVTPIETGVNYVQDTPASVARDGSLTGIAKFGEGSNGINQDFLMYIVATHGVLQPGQVREFPNDAVFSESVRVTRIK